MFALSWSALFAGFIIVSTYAGGTAAEVIAMAVFGYSLFPLGSIGVRRLHDAGHSGYLWWLALVPLGFFVLLYLWLEPSREHVDRYAPGLTGFDLHRK